MNYNKSNQRALTNADFLCAVIEDSLFGLVGPDGRPALDWLGNQLVAHINNALAMTPKPSDVELKAFIRTCCNAGGLNLVPSINNDWLEQALLFELQCMNPFMRPSASVLVADPNDMAASNLYKIHKVAMLNRKLCLFGEELIDQYKDKTVGQNNDPMTITRLAQANGPNNQPLGPNGTWLGELWWFAQRARSGTFDVPFQESDEYVNNLSNNRWMTLPITDLIKKLDKAQRNPMCPFNKKVHRKRIQDFFAPGSPRVENNERWFLAVNSGANKTQIAPDSTLGAVQRALGLPERCDISGTTTDAVGAAWQVTDRGRDADNRIYVLAAIVSMALLDHHSMDEMGAAVSLTVPKRVINNVRGPYYNPLAYGALVGLLNALKVAGNDFVPNTGMATNNWYSREWLQISGFDSDNVIVWNFNDENWRVWKLFANSWADAYAHSDS